MTTMRALRIGFSRYAFSANAAFAFATFAALTACGGAQPAPSKVAPPDFVPPPVSAPPLPAPAAESSDPNARAVEAQRPALERCYQKARGANPALARTTITLKLRADDTGKVTNVDLDYTHKFDDDAKACVRDAAFNVKLPAGAKSASVPVIFDTPAK